MNPAYLPQYSNAHPPVHYFPGTVMPNYVAWPNCTELLPGYPYVFVPQYSQVSLVPYDQLHPLIVKPQIPIVPAAIPPCPTRPLHPLRPPGGATYFPNFPNAQHSFRERQARYNPAARNYDNIAYQTHNPTMTEHHHRTREALSVTGRKISSGLRRTVNEASVQPTIMGNSVITGQRKRRFRRRRKRILENEKQTDINAGELSSINMSGSRDNLDTQAEANDRDEEINYKICQDENDTDIIRNKSRSSKQQQCTLDEYCDRDNQTKNAAPNNAEYTAIATNKSYSHVLSVKSSSRLHKKGGNTVARCSVFHSKKTESPNPRFPYLKREGGIKTNDKSSSANAKTNDYWASITNIESLWDVSIRSICSRVESELRLGNSSMHKDGVDCRCKDCLRSKQIQGKINKDINHNSAQKSPELWWDKTAGTEYEWSINYANDINNNTLNSPICQTSGQSDEFVVVDFNKNEDRNSKEKTIDCSTPEKTDTSDDFYEIHVSTNSNNPPKRRLLPVDWNSISKSQQDIAISKESTSSAPQDNITNIAALDNAIVDHGPLASDPHSLPENLQASISFTLKKLDNENRKKKSSPTIRESNIKASIASKIKESLDKAKESHEPQCDGKLQKNALHSDTEFTSITRSTSTPCILDPNECSPTRLFKKSTSCSNIHKNLEKSCFDVESPEHLKSRPNVRKIRPLEEFKFAEGQDLFRKRACAVSGVVPDRTTETQTDKTGNFQDIVDNRTFYDASKPKGMPESSENMLLENVTAKEKQIFSNSATSGKLSDAHFRTRNRKGVADFLQKQKISSWSTEPVTFIAVGADKLSVSKLVNKNASAAKSFADNGWATTFLQPVVSSKQQHNMRPFYLNKNISTYPRRLDNVKRVGSGRHRDGNSRFVPLPVVLACNTNTTRNAKRRHRVPNRRRSMSYLHQSLLSKRERHYRSKQSTTSSFLQNSREDVNWTYPSHEEKHILCPINESYFRERLKAHNKDQRLVTIQEIADETKEMPAVSSPTSRGSLKDGDDKKTERSPSASTIPPVQLTKSSINEETDTTYCANGSQDKKKTSLLKRIIKGTKTKPQKQKSISKHEGREFSTVFKGISKKQSKQDRSQEKVSKKNRLFRRHTKSDAIKSAKECDVNENIPGSTNSEMHYSDSRTPDGAKKNQQKEGDVRQPPKQDKTLRSALYKPTFLCMAAIEAPKSSDGNAEKVSLSDNVFGQNSNDAGDHFPTLIRRGKRTSRSLATTPGARINSETGDMMEMSEMKSVANMLSSTKIVECDSPAE